jgi:hypothetical protein
VSVDSGDDSGGDTDPDEVRWFAFEVDVLTGPAGDTHRRNNLQYLDVLPSDANPVAVYTGVVEGGDAALFMLSTDVVGADGKGSCIPAPSDCRFQSLKEGEEEKIDYAPNGGDADTYVIDVKDIRVDEVKGPRKAAGGPDSTDLKGAREGLAAFAAG